MKPSSRPPRKPSKLSDSVHHQLSMYALAAIAAGVGGLALAQPAESEIIYTPTHHVIGENEKYNLALNHTTTDFIISNLQCLGGTSCTSSAWAALNLQPESSRGTPFEVVGYRSGGSRLWIAALKAGERISKKQTFTHWWEQMASKWYRGSTYWGTSGPWVNVTNRYLGLKFEIDGKFHYGWARLNVRVVKGKFEIKAVLTGYAYETIPNKPIIAGKTKGPDVITLGHLAAGASAIPAWRSGK
jgi:hypothetical protein